MSQAVDMWTMRWRAPAPTVDNAKALPTAIAFDHMTTASRQPSYPPTTYRSPRVERRGPGLGGSDLLRRTAGRWVRFRSALTDMIRSAYQAQANAAVTSRSGIDAADIPAFWDWARKNCQGQLQEAVSLQMRNHDVSGYKVIADKWRSNNAPSLQALKAAGYPIRTELGRQEVYVRGSWMSAAGAARAGLI